MQVFGLWHGGHSYSGGDFTENLEMFNSVDDAITACQERMDYGHYRVQEFDYLNRDSDKCLTPCVDDSATMQVFLADPTDSDDPYPDFIITVDEETEQFDAVPA